MKRSLSAGLIALTALTGAAIAAPTQSYRAYYHILRSQEPRPIGYYQVEVEALPDAQGYRQRATIHFEWKTVFTKGQYDYQDTVNWRAAKDLSYTIVENNHGKQRRVSGETDATRQLLRITMEQKGKQHTRTIPFSQFDNTLFALRFPRPCGTEQAVHQAQKTRLLEPLSGRVSQVTGYLDRTAAPLPHGVTLPAGITAPLCLYVSTSKNKTLDRHSWLNRDGYLVYQLAPDYYLQLDPARSRLPAQTSKENSDGN